MNENNEKNQVRSDIIERYCPKRGENVVMRRTFGVNTTMSCMNYDKCDKEKDAFCGANEES